MATPRTKDMDKLKKFARYLIGRDRMIVSFDYQEAQDKVVVWTDSDYAGCRITRRSTTGGVAVLGKHTIKRVVQNAEYSGTIKR